MFSEFYCDTAAGSNLNSGSSAAGSAAFTYTSAVIVSGWDSATGIFSVASGTPNSDMAAMADGTHFASVYVTAGATVATFVGRVTAVSSTTITVSLTAKSGTAPATDALGATTLKVDGAWDGPSGAVSFPFGFAAVTMVKSTNEPPRVNFKNGVTYAITAAMTHSLQGPVAWQGYTTTVGDGGRATIDGGTGTAYTMLTASGVGHLLKDLIMSNNGNSGGSAEFILNMTGAGMIDRCVFTGSRWSAVQVTNSIVSECEFYGNNLGASTRYSLAVASSGVPCSIVRCVFHDQAAGLGAILAVNGTSIMDCIFDTVTATGGAIYTVNATLNIFISGCDFYNITGDGIRIDRGTSTIVPCTYIENSNFIKCSGYGINSAGTAYKNAIIRNCGFGTGTSANTSGDINQVDQLAEGFTISGSVNYANDVTPWVDPANGDFRINLAAAKGAGRGTFLQTAASYAGAIGYPDIGAAQHLDAGGGGGSIFGGVGGVIT